MADSLESKTPMWQGMTRRREKDALLAVIPADHLVGWSTQGIGTLSVLANLSQSGASAPGADAGGADAGGAEAGGSDAGGADCIGGEAGGLRAGVSAVEVHRAGAIEVHRAGSLAFQRSRSKLMPTAAGRLLVAMLLVVLAWLGPCSPVGGVGPSAAACRGALRGVGVGGARPAAWRCGGACRGVGVAKQPGVGVAKQPGSGSAAAGVFQSIGQVAASISGSSPRQGAPTLPIF